MKRFTLFVMCLTCALGALVMFGFGDDAAAGAAATAGAAPIVATPSAAAPVNSTFLLLVPIIVPVVLGLLKIFLPKFPGWLLPILAPLLGAAADFAMSQSFGQGTLLGAILGSAGVGLRELADQAQKNLMGKT